MTTLQERLFYLDAALTRKSDATCFHNLYMQMPTVETVIAYQYHLADSGWSRIGFDSDTGVIFLTSNSRQEVKDGWKFCKELIADVEESLAAEWENS